MIRSTDVRVAARFQRAESTLEACRYTECGVRKLYFHVFTAPDCISRYTHVLAIKSSTCDNIAMKTRLFITALCTLLIGGAIYLKVFNPQVGSPTIQMFVKSEFFHIPAHMLLYGTLAIACRNALGQRPWAVLGGVLAVGIVQEAAQSILFGRAPGLAEAFDLFVDASVTLLVLWTGSVWAAVNVR